MYNTCLQNAVEVYSGRKYKYVPENCSYEQYLSRLYFI